MKGGFFTRISIMCITSFWFTEYIYVYYIVGYCYLIRQNTSRKIVFNGYIFAFSDATKTTISALFSRKARKASKGSVITRINRN